MADVGAEVDALEPIQFLTVEVRIHNLWRLRLGLWLLSLAARVLRCPVWVNPVSSHDVSTFGRAGP